MATRKKKTELTPWHGFPVNFNPEDWAGFCYEIEHIVSGRKYIGKKSLWAITHKKTKGKKRRKRIKKESDWKTYRSSSSDLKNDIAKYGLDAFTFGILSLHKTRASLNYTELRELFIRDVLHRQLPNGVYEYYNSNIGGKWYRGNTK